MKLKAENLPMVEDAVRDHVGEVWTAQEKSPFHTLLAYLTNRRYGKERRDDEWMRRP